ncbi:hypothetical protein EDB83DRAFT_2387405 [Lactarius deliciosus]|nr:hypothetical protein EDB83DRAFT_2416523 [Lactarius deliciosus]KAH9060418.1 hypothetical protein EDB83DRAFT_2387405 [Lactarius deliciosus]
MFRMFRTLSAFGWCFAHFAHFDFSPVPQGAAPPRGLSGSSTMRRRPWRPPLQIFVSRGSVRDHLRLPTTTQTTGLHATHCPHSRPCCI